jgi:hypothetical protein|tara:strand:- start:11574 stop:11978 length:405 start_codon:yes stop_codon:yes gene_type:complete
MGQLTEEQKTEFRLLADECGLVKDDFHFHKHYCIIKRKGIEKIQANYGITVTYDEVLTEPMFFCVKATGRILMEYENTKQFVEMQTYGSACPKNCQTAYLPEMAEKRALSRVVLKLVGLYQHNILGEDELDGKE